MSDNTINNRLKRLGIGIIDKIILACAFLYVTLNTQALEGGVFQVGFNIMAVFFIVGVSYIVVWLTVAIATGWSAGIATSGWMRWGMALLAFGFTLWLYPLILSITFMLVGLNLTTDVETVLTWTFAFRFATKILLRRRLGVNE